MMMVRTLLITLFVTAVCAAPGAAQSNTLLSLPSPSTLKMLGHATVEAHESSTFAQPSHPAPDSRLNGFLIGFVAGAVPGILLGMGINSYCNNESSSDCPWAIPIVGGLFGLAGGGIGYGIDSVIHQSPTLGRPRPSPGVRLSFRF